MTNALATLQKGAIQLTETEELILSEAAQDQGAYDPIPTRIKIAPGGTNSFVTSDDESLKTFTAIIAISQKARAYWPDSGNGQPPMCSSPDGQRGYFNAVASDVQWKAAMEARDPHPAVRMSAENTHADLPPTFDCASCPLAKWGSAHQGGKQGSKAMACKTLRRIVVLVDGWAQPALLTLPPTSNKPFDIYCSSLARKRSAYFAVRSKFELEKQQSAGGNPYSTAKVSVVGALSHDELSAVISIRREFESLVREMPIDGSEYEVLDEEGNPVVETADSNIPF